MEFDYKSPDYHARRHGDLIESKRLRKAWGFYSDIAYFQNVKSGQCVLEFGAGLGNNLLVVKERAIVFAVEPSILGRRIAAEDGIASVEVIEDLGGRKYDFILCRHVLEHVEHPKSVLESLAERLNDNGTLILVLPLDPLTQRPVEPDINQHLYCWNPRTITNLLRRCGLARTNYRYEAYGAKRKLLFVFDTLGGVTYAKCVRQIGRLFRFRELVMECQK